MSVVVDSVAGRHTGILVGFACRVAKVMRNFVELRPRGFLARTRGRKTLARMCGAAGARECVAEHDWCGCSCLRHKCQLFTAIAQRNVLTKYGLAGWQTKLHRQWWYADQDVVCPINYVQCLQPTVTKKAGSRSCPWPAAPRNRECWWCPTEVPE